MRYISDASLEKLSQKIGIEPINIVDILWGGFSYIRYSDRISLPDGISGKLLEISGLENVTDISKGGHSTSLKIKLDDIDGSIKQIFDNVDIMRSSVSVYQWFSGIPISEAFLIYSGVIASPIIWNEGDRTLTFDVLSKLESLEVGFSPEQGDFSEIPAALLGKAWPLCFGTCVYVPSIRIDDIPKGLVNDQAALSKCWAMVGDLAAKIKIALQQMNLYFTAALEAYNTGDFYNFPFTYDGQAAAKYYKLGDQYTARGNQFLQEALQLQKELAYTSGNCQLLQNPGMALNVACGEDFPQGQQIQININGSGLVGTFNGSTFNVQPNSTPILSNNPNILPIAAGPTRSDDRPVAIEYSTPIGMTGGSILQLNRGDYTSIDQPYPIRYIVAGIIPVTVLGVYAHKQIEGQTLLLQVPTDYYTVDQEAFGDVSATILTMIRPLSSYQGEHWSDEIWCTVTSPIGPNTVEIMKWIIAVYTNETYDPISFGQVEAYLANYPANFMLNKRMNAIQLLKEMAYQAGCAMWLKNDIFYLKYLPAGEMPIEVITEDDVESGSFSIETTQSEDLVTKYTAKWRLDYEEKDELALIIRYNIPYYGIIEKEYNYFMYNTYDTVNNFATFWVVRNANTWKRVKFKTFLNKLRIETFDTITLNFKTNYVGTGYYFYDLYLPSGFENRDQVPSLESINEFSINILVEKTQYNSANNTIEIEAWVPIRLGEMVQYPFFWPAGLNETYAFPTQQDDRVFYTNTGGGSLGSAAKCQQSKPLKFTHAPTLGHLVGDTYNQYPQDPAFYANGLLVGPQPGSPGSQPGSPVITTAGNIPPDDISYQDLSLFPNGAFLHKEIVFKDFQDTTPDLINGVSFPAIIQGQLGPDPDVPNGMQYQVDMYDKGFINNPVQITAVQLQQDPDDEIPQGTSVIVTKGVYTDNSSSPPQQIIKYYLQNPVWLDDG